MRVKMVPQLEAFNNEESGVKRVIEAYYRYLPSMGVQFVPASEENFDLAAVHAGTTNKYDSSGVPLVSHLHGLYFTADYPAPSWEYGSNANIIESIRHADVVTVPSRWVTEIFQRDMHFTPDVLPHGVRWEDYQHDHSAGNYIIGYAKNRKGQDVCDPSFLTKFCRKFGRHTFWSTFAPDGEEVRNLFVTGILPHDQMKRAVQRASVLISTTKETFGLGILEALASGTPVLSYRYGGALDLIQHGVNGYLAEPGNLDDLAEGLNYCLQYRPVLSANAREMAKEWTWERACERVYEVYEKAIQPEPQTVSVVIPVYNKPVEELQRAIASVAEQTRIPDKIVVVDDGSNNGVDYQAEVEIWSGTLPIEYVRQENAGVAYARNKGIEIANTTYVCCLDSDDAIAPGFLRVCLDTMTADKSVGVVYTQLRWHKPDGTEGISQWPEPWNYDQFLRKKNQVPTCCLFRTKMWRRLGGYRQRYAPDGAGAEDAEFFLRAGANGWRGKMAYPHPQFYALYWQFFKLHKRLPERDDLVSRGITEADYDTVMSSMFDYSWMSGQVTGNKEYKEVDWLAWHPWVKDGQHPIASLATPVKQSHSVRQYDEPVVSVIIPVGPGHAEHVIAALDSLESQTFRRWEAIVVDDTGNLEEAMKLTSILKSYPYVRFQSGRAHTVSSLNGEWATMGAGKARNVGVKIARAPFLLFLDADDWIYPEAIDKMLQAWGETGGAVYSDTVGIAEIKDPSELGDPGNLLAYNEKRKEGVVLQRAAPFDCERAARQPANPPYLWCNITTLIPKAWHDEVGGFDESMESWEDLLYWYQIAWSGKCFTHIPEPLLVYRYKTGSRRDKVVRGSEDGSNPLWGKLLGYITEKWKGVEPVCKGGCGGGTKRNEGGTINENFARASREQNSKAVSNMADDDYTMARYDHPNKGPHHVYGGGNPRRYYNYRRGGGEETFLVHVEDVRLYPKWFTPIETKAAAPVAVVAPTPPPTPLPSVRVDRVDESSSVATPAPSPVDKIMQRANDQARFDLQLLPGVTPQIEGALRRAGISTAQDILDKGVEGLREIKFVGAVRAAMIYEHVKDRYATVSPTPIIAGDVAAEPHAVQ